MSLSVKQIAGVLLFLLISMPVSADIYTWTDANGVKHYANQPPANKNGVRTGKEIKHDSEQYEQWDQLRRESQDNALKSGNAAQTKQTGKKNLRDNPGSVVMYTTPTCGYCNRARSFFSRHNIAVTDYDITTDISAMERFKALKGRGVPLIFVGDNRISGFNEAQLKRLLGVD